MCVLLSVSASLFLRPVSISFCACVSVPMCVCAVTLHYIIYILMQGATGVPGGSVANEDTPRDP